MRLLGAVAGASGGPRRGRGGVCWAAESQGKGGEPDCRGSSLRPVWRLAPQCAALGRESVALCYFFARLGWEQRPSAAAIHPSGESASCLGGSGKASVYRCPPVWAPRFGGALSRPAIRSASPNPGFDNKLSFMSVFSDCG